MTLALISHRNDPDYLVSTNRQVLARIADPGISFAVWQRSLSPTVLRALAAWVDEHSIDLDHVLTPRKPLLTALPELASLPAPAGIHEDVEQLLCEFREISGSKRVRVVLCVKTTDACRKFHTDNVRLRLITTYVGPGTEWIPDAGVDRAALHHPPECPCDANRTIARDPQWVRHASTGDVLLMKGELYGGAPGAVHRSPPIEERGLKRLVLTLTAVD